jgi:hypothetical protein
MNRIPLHIIEIVIFFKLLCIISLARSGHFLKLLLELFHLPITRGCMWAESQKRNVCNTIIRIVVTVVARLFRG